MKFTFQGKDHTDEFEAEDIRLNKLSSVFACTGVLFFLPLVTEPDSKYGRYWSNQGLLILIVMVILGIISAVAGGILGLLGSIGIIGIMFRMNNKDRLYRGHLGCYSGICFMRYHNGDFRQGKGYTSCRATQDNTINKKAAVNPTAAFYNCSMFVIHINIR